MPPLKKQNINIVKVPLRSSPIDRPQVFPRMPRLYLELIENKSKIKQDLIDKEYIASESPRGIEQVPKEPFTKRLDLLLSDDDSSVGDRSRDRGNRDRDDRDRYDDRDRDDRDRYDDRDRDDSRSRDADTTVSELSIHENKERDDESKDTDDLSIRLKELLKDDGSVVSDITLTPKKRHTVDNKYSRPRDNNGYSTTRVNIESQSGKHFANTAPTLAELEKQGGYFPKKELRDINQPSRTDAEEEDGKREMLFKFDLLKKSYPGSNIPEYTIHTDYNTLEKSYSDVVRRLSLDSSVESYKTYLVYGFMGCEFLFGNFLGFDMQGFTQQQIISMNSYEKLLIELGEKSYVPTQSKWPVEVRLLFMIIMNAAFFIVSKMMMKKTGSNLMGMINNMNAKPNVNSNPPAQKKRMQGPTINVDDMPSI
jgi:hypothetical protein